MNDEHKNSIKNVLKKSKININELEDLNGMIIPREIFLDNGIYNELKDDINILKKIFTSSYLTSLQSTAEKNQKWPLLNLIRQILKSCNYNMIPKRLSNGYTKDGKKLYKRVFIIEKYTKIQINQNEELELQI